MNPEDITMPPFITDMEGKTFTFHVRVNTYNFTAHHQTFTITHILTEHERVPVPDYVVDVRMIWEHLIIRLHIFVCVIIRLDQGGTMVMMPICRTVTEFLNRLKLKKAVVMEIRMLRKTLLLLHRRRGPTGPLMWPRKPCCLKWNNHSCGFIYEV